MAILILIAGVSLVAVLIATSEAVSSNSLARSSKDLLAARAAFDRLVDVRAESAAKATRLVVELPTLRDALIDVHASTDRATMTGIVDHYRLKLGAAFGVVTNRDGQWTGSAGLSGDSEPPAALASAIASARLGTSTSEIVTVGDKLFLVVSEPARFGEEILGTLTTGFGLDDAMARELAIVTHGEVSFICGARLCGSSLAPPARESVTGILEGQAGNLGQANDPPALRQIGGTRYVSARYPLRAGAPSGSELLLLQDWTPTAETLQRIQRVLAAVGGTAFGIAFVGAVIFSRRMTRPLRDLASAANQIASGRWSERVPVDGPAEARTMAEAFNHMTATLSHWHEQAEQRARQLWESYERFRSVTDSTSDAIVSITTQGRIVFWNLQAEVVFGYSKNEMIGQSLDRILPDPVYANLADALAAGDGRWLGHSVELHALRRDGTEVPVELSMSMWKTASEVFYTGVIRDITERREAADALKLREDQLRQAQKMEAVGRLAGGVAHDFNNLLTAILGYADLLADQLTDDALARTQLVEIQKAGRSAASLTRDLLAFSRKQVRQPVALDLNHVVSRAENLLRRLIGEDIELVIALEPCLQPVQADPTQIEQVLVNLAVNARDAMPDGGRLTITTANLDGADPAQRGLLSQTGPHAALVVSDTGVGMTDDVRAHIFEPFFTTKDAGHGTGLGLSTVYGIVQQSDGTVLVDSAPGRGSTFTICLPATAAPIERPAPVSDTSDARHRGTETVLLVEDNEAVRTMAREALIRFGYTVIVAPNGRDALKVASESLDRISIVLTDMVMPLMGGRELAARLREIRPDLKFVFTSGYASDPVIDGRPHESGAIFLQKPFSPALLGRTIREALDAQVA